MKQNERKFTIELTVEEIELIEKALMAFEDEVGDFELRSIARYKRMLDNHIPYFGGDDAKMEAINDSWRDFFEKTDPIIRLRRKFYRIGTTQVNEP